MYHDLFDWMSSWMTGEVGIWMIPTVLLISLVVFLANRPVEPAPPRPKIPPRDDL